MVSHGLLIAHTPPKDAMMKLDAKKTDLDRGIRFSKNEDGSRVTRQHLTNMLNTGGDVVKSLEETLGQCKAWLRANAPAPPIPSSCMS